MASYVALAVEEDKEQYELADSPRSTASSRVSHELTDEESDGDEDHTPNHGIDAQGKGFMHGQARNVGLIAAGLVVGWLLAMVTVPYGSNHGSTSTPSSAASIAKEDLPLCDRLMLFDWSTMRNGLGSTLTTLLQSAYIAKQRNYTLVVSRDANVYGTYYGLFATHEPPTCRLTSEMYEVQEYDDGLQNFREMMKQGKKSRTDDQPNRILFNFDLVLDQNRFFRSYAYGDYSDLEALPPLDARHPLLSEYTVPDMFRPLYLEFAELSEKYLSLTHRLDLRLEQRLYELKLGVHKKTPTVGYVGKLRSLYSKSHEPCVNSVHWRSGDKVDECTGSEVISCTNVTRHCETAWDALDEVKALVKEEDQVSLPSSRLSGVKAAIAKVRLQHGKGLPRLLLMTAEKDGLQLFRQDEYCRRRFVIQGMAQSGSLTSFAMSAFNSQSKLDRIENAQQLLVQTTALVRHADAAVFGIISNVGRSIAFPQAGAQRVLEEKRIRSVDIYWHPLHYAPFVGTCDGTWGPCFPGM